MKRACATLVIAAAISIWSSTFAIMGVVGFAVLVWGGILYGSAYAAVRAIDYLINDLIGDLK